MEPGRVPRQFLQPTDIVAQEWSILNTRWHFHWDYKHDGVKANNRSNHALLLLQVELKRVQLKFISNNGLIWNEPRLLHRREDVLLVTALLLNLLNLLGGWPLARRVHHTGHSRARHWAVTVSGGTHGWSLWSHTARRRHSWSLRRKMSIFLMKHISHQSQVNAHTVQPLILKLLSQAFKHNHDSSTHL